MGEAEAEGEGVDGAAKVDPLTLTAYRTVKHTSFFFSFFSFLPGIIINILLWQLL